MNIYSYEEAFGAWDKTSKAMRQAVKDWFSLYYGDPEQDSCQRVAYAVVSKLMHSIFGEYRTASDNGFCRSVLQQLDQTARQAMEMTLVGGECYIKPCLEEAGFSFSLIPRSNVLIFGRDSRGNVTDMGTVACSTEGRYYYTLLERRTLDNAGFLTIRNRLYRSANSQNLGVQIPLGSHPAYRHLPEEYRYTEPLGNIGLVQVKTPILNCVDGSADGVSVYAPAVELIRNIDENENQLRGEFRRGQSRIVVSKDLLRDDGSGMLTLADDLFVGLDEDPEQVGITIFAPELRYQAYLERKQEYLRNVESLIGMKRGMLSDANVDDRTATEISASAGDYNLTVIHFQKMWDQAVTELLALCCVLARLYRKGQPPEVPEFSIDWGNGVLYDENKTWAEYRDMVACGLLKPEIALGWRFAMPAETEAQRQAIRDRLMPA